MFSALRSDFVRMSYASYAAELLDQVVAEGQPDGELFLLILQTFSSCRSTLMLGWRFVIWNYSCWSSRAMVWSWSIAFIAERR